MLAIGKANAGCIVLHFMLLIENYKDAAQQNKLRGAFGTEV